MIRSSAEEVCWSVCLGGVSFVVSIGSADVLARLRTVFPQAELAIAADSDSDKPQVRLVVERQRSCGLFRVLLDDKPIGHRLAADEAVALVEHRIIRETALRTRSHLAFHGAAVADSKGVVALLGEGGSGKTTLCAELVSRGWDYFSDELALVELTTRRASPFHRALLFKPQVSAAQSSWASARPTIADGRRYVHWDALHPESAGYGAKVRKLVFCHYRPSCRGEMSLVVLRPAEVVRELAQLCLNFHQLGRVTVWKALWELADQLPAVDLVYKEAKQAVPACS